MLRYLITTLTLLGVANATCPNGCSGHGTCGVDDVCTCHAGWGMGGKPGGDCSDRFCPYELAWVDGPTHDGLTHNYAECSNKGTCNRETGQCKCFTGYTGKGCARQSCPDDCTGNGRCRYMKDIPFGNVYHDYYDGSTLALSGLGVGAVKLTDYSWDTDRARMCVCDPGWTGIKCDKRMCPVSNDIMDASTTSQTQTITLFDQNGNNSNFHGQTFAIKFTTKLNATYTTQPIYWHTSDAILEGYIETALKKLPHRVIDDVTVTVNSSIDANGVIIEVEFTGTTVQGRQHKLEILTEECGHGCSPQITGLANIRTHSLTELSSVTISTTGSHPEVYECGRRGKCDQETGICDCFDGYKGDSCNIFNPGA